jgi:hypothetical protein
MGALYLAQHCVMNMLVALQVVSPAELEHPKPVPHFLSRGPVCQSIIR